jgi:hypothetical protein
MPTWHNQRKPGTGSIRRAGDKWEARGPIKQGRRGAWIGMFDYYHKAEKALKEHLEQTSKNDKES